MSSHFFPTVDPNFEPMFGSINETGHYDHQQVMTYSSNCSQTNFITSLLNDFESDSYFNLNGDNFLDSSEASSPPPTPEIISSFAGFPPESPISTTPPIYQNLSSPHMIQSPLSSSTSTSSMSMSASPPTTVQETRKKLIKDSLRLTIQTRRMNLGLDDFGTSQLSPSETIFTPSSTDDNQLTEADAERRRRRRERNKVAATKCRNKKKQHSVLLVQESETLEVSNAQMRKEINDLEKERQQLMNILNSHQPMCQVTTYNNNYTSSHSYNINNNSNNFINLKI